MPGSNLNFNLPNAKPLSHQSLNDRDKEFQHPLNSIYRVTDGKDLDTILKELQYNDTTVKYEVFEILEDGTNEINLTKFSYNMVRDVLYVNVAGVDCNEGTDNQYVKISPTQIKFNFELKQGYIIIVAIAGTISNESFGDDVYCSLSKFTQLVDTPKDYTNQAGKFLKVNDNETGLIFSDTIGSTNLKSFEYTCQVEANSSLERWISFTKSGIIKGIRIEPTTSTKFDFAIWTKPNGSWIYFSGTIESILWDIMDIPFIDESSQDSIYVRLNNSTNELSDFKIKIYILI